MLANPQVQHVYDKKDVPAPTDNQPAHGHFSHSIAKKTHTDNRNAPGGFNKSKSKTYIEQVRLEQRTCTYYCLLTAKRSTCTTRGSCLGPA